MTRSNYKTANYTVEIEVSRPTDEVFNHLIDLKKWWPEDFEGEDLKPDSEFTLATGDSHYSRNKVIEFVPDKKLVWLATEAIRKTDGYDWTGTKFIFELIPKGENTIVRFTYDGVVLENEADRLVQICDMTLKELFYNVISNGFTVTIEVEKSPQTVFKSITDGVRKWWGGKDLTGNSTALNDEFIINHPNAHYSKQKLVEVVLNKRIVWLVTESTLNWLQKDRHEWQNTRMIFEISQKADKTILHFIHQGLVPEKECFLLCHEGWNTVIKDYLFNYISRGKAHF